MTEEQIERQAESDYYTYTKERGLQYPWNMLDENTKSHWRKRVLSSI